MPREDETQQGWIDVWCGWIREGSIETAADSAVDTVCADDVRCHSRRSAIGKVRSDRGWTGSRDVVEVF
jgi:hypothetical protein